MSKNSGQVSQPRRKIGPPLYPEKPLVVNCYFQFFFTTRISPSPPPFLSGFPDPFGVSLKSGFPDGTQRHIDFPHTVNASFDFFLKQGDFRNRLDRQTAGAPSFLMDRGRPAHSRRRWRRLSSWTVGTPPTADGRGAVSPHGPWAPRPLQPAGAASLLMDYGHPAHSRRRGRRLSSRTVGAPPTADGGGTVSPHGPWAPRPLRTAGAPSLLMDRGRPAHCGRRGRRLSSWIVGAPPTADGRGTVLPHGPWAPRPLQPAGAPSLLMDRGRPAHCARRGRRLSSWTVGAPPTADGRGPSLLTDRGRPAHCARQGRRPSSRTVGAPPTPDGGDAVPPHGPWAPRPPRTAGAPSLLMDCGRPAHCARRGRRLSSWTVGTPPTAHGGGAVSPHGLWAPRPLRTARAPSLLMDCGRPAHCGRRGHRPSSWTVVAPPTADGGGAVSPHGPWAPPPTADGGGAVPPHGPWAPRPLRTAGAPSLLMDRGRPAHCGRRGRRLSS